MGVEELLKDLLAYAKRYEILLNGNTKNKALDSCINRLNRLETTVTRPFFLEVLRLNNEGKLDVSPSNRYISDYRKLSVQKNYL